MNLLYLHKAYHVFDTEDPDKTIGGVYIFEDLEESHRTQVDDAMLPDFVIVMIVNGDILETQSNYYTKEEIIEYFNNNYTKEQLIEL